MKKKIGIIGLGYVGLPLAIEFSKKREVVAFDKNKHRLGYGGGFYDRYLHKLNKKKNFLSIGIAFSFQEVKKIPINKFDYKLDLVITERSIIKWNYFF